MNNPNIVRTDSSLWAEIDANSKLGALEMLAKLKKPSEFLLTPATVAAIQSNPSAYSFSNAGEVKVNQSAVNILLADKPKGLVDLMKGNITIR